MNNYKCKECGTECYIYYANQKDKCERCEHTPNLRNMRDIRTYFKVKKKDKK